MVTANILDSPTALRPPGGLSRLYPTRKRLHLERTGEACQVWYSLQVYRHEGRYEEWSSWYEEWNEDWSSWFKERNEKWIRWLENSANGWNRGREEGCKRWPRRFKGRDQGAVQCPRVFSTAVRRRAVQRVYGGELWEKVMTCSLVQDIPDLPATTTIAPSSSLPVKMKALQKDLEAIPETDKR